MPSCFLGDPIFVLRHSTLTRILGRVPGKWHFSRLDQRKAARYTIQPSSAVAILLKIRSFQHSCSCNSQPHIRRLWSSIMMERLLLCWPFFTLSNMHKKAATAPARAGVRASPAFCPSHHHRRKASLYCSFAKKDWSQYPPKKRGSCVLCLAFL